MTNHFIHEPYQPDETIAAIATPPGEGGVAIVRISGKDALAVADIVFSGSVKKYTTHTLHYGIFQDSRGRRLDDGLCAVFLGSKSYTGEDTVELQCHGGNLVTRQVLEATLEAGARQAKPGEFTFKAYKNGKLDLAQAEAVQELIGAKNQYALEAAEGQLQGRLSEKVRHLQESLTQIAAMLEAWVDFPEEDIEFAPLDEVINQLEIVREELYRLLNSYHDGKIALEGVSLCLAGAPNVGKSSLMNALLDRERAIVTDIPGTTRDLLEDQLRLGDLNFRLIDTAGLRDTNEVIEQEGIRRSKQAMVEADLILLVLDVTQGLTEEAQAILDQTPEEKTLVIWNKADLPHSKPPTLDIPHVSIASAVTRQGFDSLSKQINSIVWNRGPPSQEELLITNVRHKEALEEALEHIDRLTHGLNNRLSPEFLTLDVRSSLSALGKILGLDITEDILTSIFSTFCIGK
jgi:tRNA modification GTPase